MTPVLCEVCGTEIPAKRIRSEAGRLAGSRTSRRKRLACKCNGRKGGRPIIRLEVTR